MRQTSRLILSVAIAAGLLWLTETLADRMNLAFVNTWALMHGMWLVVLPVYSVLAYLVLGGTAAISGSASLAVLSAVLVCVGSLVPFGSVPGLVLGHLARYRSHASAQNSGRAISLIALIVGYVALAFWAYVFIVVGRATQARHP